MIRQVAGVLAALSVKNKTAIREINIRNVQQVLLDANAYLLPLVDVDPSDKAFQAIQRVAASGILKVKGEPYKWANRTWFYPDTTLTVKEFSEGLHDFDNKVAISNDESILTVNKAISLISGFWGRDLMPEVQKMGEEVLPRKFDLQKAITKRELSVLSDELLRPFETKQIGFDGFYR
jgi:predicted amino acid-binding ACT domain protein